MKNYARKKSTPNKTAYRTPSRFRVNKNIDIRQEKAQYFNFKSKNTKYK